MTNYIIKDTNITVREIYNIIENNNSLSLSRVVISKVNKSRLYLEKKISESNTPFYGVNTGFGDLHNIQIKNDDLATLQSNLIKSHACGTGKKVVSTQGKGFNNADSEISTVLFKMSLLTSDDLFENAIVNKIVLTLLK